MNYLFHDLANMLRAGKAYIKISCFVLAYLFTYGPTVPIFNILIIIYCLLQKNMHGLINVKQSQQQMFLLQSSYEKIHKLQTVLLNDDCPPVRPAIK